MQYRIEKRNRIAARTQRAAKLAGDPAYRRQLEENWLPVLQAREPIPDIIDPFDEYDNTQES